MIITCNNCSKKFNLDSSLIPEKGRLLQCNGCNYKWFFKKAIINEAITPIKIIKPDENIEPVIEEFESEEIETPKIMELLDKKNEEIASKTSLSKNKKNEEIASKTNPSKNKKNYNILSLIIVFIISFTGLIIILDTFQAPIGKIVPNIEFLLYNLYETINDIKLFLKDLI
tara:strand:- start:261 stop:773 length:513 start_codon:yes stop_codon:yes gene_type:complete